ncbi:hypothetical protein N200_02320 [Helicobacter pylori UM065]|nr:hypothetical protein N200_02320 [Helicobacter pylori UM065]
MVYFSTRKALFFRVACKSFKACLLQDCITPYS